MKGEGAVMVKLGEVCSVLASKNPIQSNEVWLLNLDVVEQQTGKVLEYHYVPIDDLTSSTVAFDKKTVLYSKLRPNLNKVVLPDRDGYATSEMLPLQPDERYILREYLAWYLRSPSFVEYAVGKVAGAKMPRLGASTLMDTKIPLYRLDEQKQIAAILNSISSLIDLWGKQIQRLDDLIKARFVEMFGDPEYNNMGWPTDILGQLCEVGSSKRIYQEEQTTDGVPFWRISDLVNKMDTGAVESTLFIPEDRYLDLRRQGLVPEAGDILVTSRGTLGRCYIISPEDRFYFQDGMISWLRKYKKGITPLYLQYLFEMPGFRKQIDEMQAGSTVAYLSIAMIKRLKVMIPDSKSQEQFTAFVSQVDKSKLMVQEGLEQLETLKKALMQEYFG